MAPTEPAENNQIDSQQPPSGVPHSSADFDFDRPVLIRCVEMTLADKEWREMMMKLIATATVKVYPQNLSDERWLDPGKLRSFRSSNVSSISTTGVQSVPVPAPIEAEEVIDLYSLHDMLPSAEGRYPNKLAKLDYGEGLFISTAYLLTGLMALFFNFITVIVLQKSASRELRRYLINLSVSDILMSCFVICKSAG